MSLTNNREDTAVTLNAWWASLMNQCQSNLPPAISDPNGDGSIVLSTQELYESDITTSDIAVVMDLMTMLPIFGERWGYGSWRRLPIKDSYTEVGIFTKSPYELSRMDMYRNGGIQISRASDTYLKHTLPSDTLTGYEDYENLIAVIRLKVYGASYAVGGSSFITNTVDGFKSPAVVGSVEGFEDEGIDEWYFFLDAPIRLTEVEFSDVEYFTGDAGLAKWQPPGFELGKHKEYWDGFPSIAVEETRYFATWNTADVSAQANGVNKVFNIPVGFESGSASAIVNGLRYEYTEFISDAAAQTLTFNTFAPGAGSDVKIQFAPI